MEQRRLGCDWCSRAESWIDGNGLGGGAQRSVTLRILRLDGIVIWTCGDV